MRVAARGAERAVTAMAPVRIADRRNDVFMWAALCSMAQATARQEFVNVRFAPISALRTACACHPRESDLRAREALPLGDWAIESFD